jgi:hypothetical protein
MQGVQVPIVEERVNLQFLHEHERMGAIPLVAHGPREEVDPDGLAGTRGVKPWFKAWDGLRVGARSFLENYKKFWKRNCRGERSP